MHEQGCAWIGGQRTINKIAISCFISMSCEEWFARKRWQAPDDKHRDNYKQDRKDTSISCEMDGCRFQQPHARLQMGKNYAMNYECGENKTMDSLRRQDKTIACGRTEATNERKRRVIIGSSLDLLPPALLTKYLARLTNYLRHESM